MNQSLTIATRQSPLALWQAHYVKEKLLSCHPDLTIDLLGITTEGDIRLDSSLATIGGKGLFVKELEQALFDKRADIAVHSMKDVPMVLPEGLTISTVCQRANPFDVLVSSRFKCLADLPQGAVVGTSSLRRQCQLLHHRPDLQFQAIRGNVGTRLLKLDAGEADAIILAAAGLERLGEQDRICEQLDDSLCLPAVGQGAVGIECRQDDVAVQSLLTPLHHQETAWCVTAERAISFRLQGGCQMPLAGFAQVEDNCLNVRGLLGSPCGERIIRADSSGACDDAEQLGCEVAGKLISQGAHDILAELS